MRVHRDLRKLQAAATSRLIRLRRRAHQSTSPATEASARELGITYSVVELYNLWYSFSRCLYLSAALGARDGAGSRVRISVPTPKTIEDALTHAIRTRPRYRNSMPPWNWWHEPSWIDANVLLDSLRTIGASNEQHVSAALSVRPSVFNEIRLFRNFYAHRNEDTSRQLKPLIRRYLMSPSLRPTEALASPAMVQGLLRPQPLLLDWIDDIFNTVTLIV